MALRLGFLDFYSIVENLASGLSPGSNFSSSFSPDVGCVTGSSSSPPCAALRHPCQNKLSGQPPLFLNPTYPLVSQIDAWHRWSEQPSFSLLGAIPWKHVGRCLRFRFASSQLSQRKSQHLCVQLSRRVRASLKCRVTLTLHVSDCSGRTRRRTRRTREDSRGAGADE